MDELRDGIPSVLSFPAIYDVFQRLVGAERLRERLIRQFVRPFAGAKLLDIGCGTGSIIEYLPSSVEYVGFDVSSRYISHAKRKYKERGTFFVQRVNAAVLEARRNQFDIVLAFLVLHHLSDAEADSLFAAGYASLKSGGCLVTCDNVFVNDQSALARYIISKDRGRHIRTPEQYMGLARRCFDQVSGDVAHDLLRIPYTHFIMRCSKP